MKKRVSFQKCNFYFLILLLGFCCPGAVTGEIVDIQLSTGEKGQYVLSGRFKTHAPRQIVWSVLTDYDRIGEFVSFVTKNNIKTRIDGTILLEQESVGNFWFFSKTIHLLLKIQEDPLKSIYFEDLAQRDFHLYEGSWTLDSIDDHFILVQYRLKAIKLFFAPDFITRAVFRDRVASYLTEVKTEIEKKWGQVPTTDIGPSIPQ